MKRGFLLAASCLVIGAGAMLQGCGSGLHSIPATISVTISPGYPLYYATVYTAFGDSITCGFVSATASTSPPYSINDPSCRQANAYPYVISGSTAIPVRDYGIPGDQACDIWVRQIAPQAVSPSLADPSSFLYSMIIGTNDANAKGAGPYEPNFNSCQQASLTWLAIPVENKALPAASAVTGSFLRGSAATLGSYATASAPGTDTYTITTYGGPIYLWHTLWDGLQGTGTYSVDGIPRGVFNTQPSLTPIATQNGTYASVAVERIPQLTAGLHTVTVSWSSGVITVLGVGTPYAPSVMQHPTVTVGEVPLNDLSLANLNEYSADILANVTLLKNDGLDIRFAPNHQYMTGSAAELQSDGVHPTPLGALHLAQSILAPLEATPLTARAPVANTH